MSKIEIINRALIKLGEPPISSLSDEALGKTYDILYNDIKNLLLSSYPWRFAVKFKTLALSEERYGQRYMHRLPSDFLLLLKVCGGKTYDTTDMCYGVLQNYEVCGEFVVTKSASPIWVEYVAKCDDEQLFPPLFREAMATKLASEFSMRVKHSPSLKQILDNDFLMLIRQAELNNEIEKDVEILPDNSWVSVRV